MVEAAYAYRGDGGRAVSVSDALALAAGDTKRGVIK
jgi:hypothetical protein